MGRYTVSVHVDINGCVGVLTSTVFAAGYPDAVHKVVDENLAGGLARVVRSGSARSAAGCSGRSAWNDR